MKPTKTGSYWNLCGERIYFDIDDDSGHVSSPQNGYMEFFCCIDDLSEDYTPVPSFEEYNALLATLESLQKIKDMTSDPAH